MQTNEIRHPPSAVRHPPSAQAAHREAYRVVRRSSPSPEVVVDNRTEAEKAKKAKLAGRLLASRLLD